MDLSRQYTEVLDPKVHALTVGAELKAIPGESGAIEEGAHAHDDRAESDLKEGQPGGPNMHAPEGVAHSEPDSTWEELDPNAPVHLRGMGPEVLLEVEGIAVQNASVEGDRDPLFDLQEPGVSHLATQEKARSLILPSPTPPTTPEAASTQRSPAANTGTPAIPVPDHSADLEPQLHVTPLPKRGRGTSHSPAT